jgi:hypothetical protein
MTSAEETKPFEYDVPDEYERHIEDAKAGLDVVPRDENWEIAQRMLAEAPSREAVEAAQRQAAEAMAALAEFQQARHTGYDPDQTAKVVLDAGGRLAELQFGVDTVRIGNHGIAAAVGAAWTDAEARRAEHATAFAERGKGFAAVADMPVVAETERIMRETEAAIAAREHERFERTTEDGLCKLAVNLRGRISEVVFLQNNVLNLTDRHTLAEQLTAAVTAAQAAAAAEVDAVIAPYYDGLG